MSSVYLIFLFALIAAVIAMPAVRWAGERMGFVAHPEARKIHSVPIPQIGGIAMLIAALLAIFFFGELYNVPQLVGILVSATWVSLVGAWDDRRELPPLVKFVGQLIGVILLIMAGVQVTFLPYSWMNWLITVAWVIGITNAINFLDNMDGLSGGITAVASAFFLVMAVRSGQYLVASLSAALLGVSLGFLVYNFRPASIFMGDSGSLFLGLMLATVGIKLRFPSNSAIITWMVPVVVLGVPIFDTALVTISRLRRGLNPATTPGQDHTSHRLVRIGYTRREAVMALYLVGGVLGLISELILEAERLAAYGILVSVAVAGVVALWYLEKIPVNQPINQLPQEKDVEDDPLSNKNP
jgi:UDP-GlcNAc:undecaprenyl-phosphate GlcNAc-1-phosphate transferase